MTNGRPGGPAATLLATLLVPAVAAADETIRDLFARVTDSVVVIRTLERMVVDGPAPAEQAVSDLGSGVVISNDGKVVTAAHLVQAADRVVVRFRGGTVAEARVVATEPTADIALLQLETVPEELQATPLGDSDKARVGDRVMVVGAPLGLEHSLSVGYISARHDAANLAGPLQLGEYFQTDAAINRGTSGGPMFNQLGEVIGVVSYILSATGGFQGIGFAVTSNTVKDVLIERTGFWSGMTVFALSALQARALNLPRDHGVLVQRIADGSVADQIGLRPGFLPSVLGQRELVLGGDVILSVDGFAVGADQDYRALRTHFAKLKPGQKVTLELFRRGNLVTQTVDITENWLHRRGAAPGE